MPGHSIVQDLVLLYGLALLLLLAAGRARVPAIVTLIVTGMLASPGALGLVQSEESVATLSELGVALLLFMVGLELPFGDIGRLWRSVATRGGAQLVMTMAATAPIAGLLLGWRGDTIVFVALFVAVSSTSIVVRELTRRNELHAPHGSVALAILLLQDLAALIAMVLAPVVFGSARTGLAVALVQIVVIAAGLGAATRVVLPGLFRLATFAGREAFGLAVVVASVGTAWLASMLGLSMTIGAFLAGLVLDESEFSHQIHAEIRPLRDLLTSLFFISVGLLVSPAALLPVAPLVIALAGALMVLKAGATLLGLFIVGVPRRVAATAALGLAQIGEFSFVLGREAVGNGAIDTASWQVLLGASVLTMMAAPWLVGKAPAFGHWMGGATADLDAPGRGSEPLEQHVVILGFGVGGRLIAGALRDVETPHVILELDGLAVRGGVARGYHILYGDATASEPLVAAGVARAAAVVAVLSDPAASERATRVVRALNGAVPILVRTRARTEVARLNRAGATLVIVEELEASLEVAAQLLARLDVPDTTVEDLVVRAREALSAPTLRTPGPAPATVGQVWAALGDTPVASHVLGTPDWAVNRTLASLDLRAHTGATILAVRRGNDTHAPPPVDWQFAAGDVLYAVGSPVSLRRARAYLQRGVPEPAEAPEGRTGPL